LRQPFTRSTYAFAYSRWAFARSSSTARLRFPDKGQGATDTVHLSIDAADDTPGIALSSDPDLLSTRVWHTERNHSVELLPAIDRLLTETHLAKSDLTAVFVDVGPGGYASLRVGVSIAKSIAHALQIPLVAVGRLELDAYLVRGTAAERRIIAAHQSGRGEIAWAAYRNGDEWHEESAPRITKADDFAKELRPDDALTGDIGRDVVRSMLGDDASLIAANGHRVTALAARGAQRLAEGHPDDPIAAVPLYLRAPAIGPQR
jgi:tRNA threonylcarbamoyladenosine biosynthesis protein TsaB